MPDEQPKWTRAEELKRLLMEEPTAAKEYILSSAYGAVEAAKWKVVQVPVLWCR